MNRYNPLAQPRKSTGITAPSAPTGISVDAATAPATPSSGLKKLSFGNIAKKTADTGKTSYPVLPDPHGQAAIIGERIIKRSDEFDALKSALETDKAELRMIATPYYFKTNHGRSEAPSSIIINSPAGEVLVTFQNKYPKLDSEVPVEAILRDRTGKFFGQSFDFTIKGDKLPRDKAQELIDELQQLFAKYMAVDALEVKDCIKPHSTFHEARHLELTVEENLALEEVCPIGAMVKTKGRK